MPYIPFTDEQRRRANAVDLAAFLRRRGEMLLSSGRDKRLAGDHSITIRGSAWFDHATGKGGHAISFVQNYYGLSYAESVSLLLGCEGYPAACAVTEQAKKPFKLPPANKNMRRVFAYLVKRRGIDRDIVAHFARAELLYEDAKYHNAVFVGMDESGTPRHAHRRGTNSDGKPFRANVEGSDPRYSFHHTGTDGSLYVFEAPIDLLSYITLCPDRWQEHSYVACCGTSIQPVLWMLTQQPIQTVSLCLDHDEAGQTASARMALLLREQGVQVERRLPTRKDWNEDLTTKEE